MAGVFGSEAVRHKKESSEEGIDNEQLSQMMANALAATAEGEEDENLPSAFRLVLHFILKKWFIHWKISLTMG